MKEIFVVFLIYSMGFLVFSDDENKAARCEYLNTVRTNFTTCCRYPVLVVWKFNYNLCVSECKNKNLEDSICCILGCSFEKSDLFRRIYRGYLTSSPNGVYASFMLSVGNDTNWASTVRESVNQCYTKLADPFSGFYCDGTVPKDFYPLIDCVYVTIYKKCPLWNPNQVAACQETKEFAEKCLE